MHTTLAAQLAQLELGHLAIDRTDRPGTTDLAETAAIEQTLAAIWSDLLALFPDTALEDDAEEIAWGLVNLFHRAAAKRSAQVDRATDEIRVLLASADGSEVHSTELERQIARAQSAEAAMLGLEAFREAAAQRGILGHEHMVIAGPDRLQIEQLADMAAARGREAEFQAGLRHASSIMVSARP